MDELKKYIDDRRTAFETDRLPEGHRERFAAKMSRTGRFGTSPLRYAVALGAAALVAAGVFLSNDALRRRMDPVLSETEAFYRTFETLSEQAVFAGQRRGADTAEIRDILQEIRCDGGPLHKQLPDELSDAEKVRILRRYFNLKLDAVKQLQAQLSEDE